jgi:hypothetical protein
MHSAFAEGEPVVVRNGHHRAIAVIALMKKGEISPDTVVGDYDGVSVTAKQLLQWYDSGKLLAYNRAHSLEQAEELMDSFDPRKVLLASPGNPKGGIIFTRRQLGEALSEFKNMKRYGSVFERPNCGDSLEVLCGTAAVP